MKGTFVVERRAVEMVAARAAMKERVGVEERVEM